jgi:hypothetical protein
MQNMYIFRSSVFRDIFLSIWRPVFEMGIASRASPY